MDRFCFLGEAEGSPKIDYRQKGTLTLSSLLEDLVSVQLHLAAGQHQWDHFGVGAPPTLVYFSWDLGCSLGVRGFDPWPFTFQLLLA